jgi:hypothetical protein
MAALTECPWRVVQMFNKREFDETGVVSVTFFDAGCPIEICVDDRIPCLDRGGGPQTVCAKSKGKEIWTMALEKAFAKLFGSFEGIGSGGVAS